ncbi:MAG: DUF2281 domain-containing protein [Clostridiales bacterium]|nr:DUF2281 domain-containing protein [Clostridiales bacterium]
MNSAKEKIKRLVDELPESRAGEVIDFLLYLKNKKDDDLYLDVKEEEEIWNLIKTDERVSSDKAKELIGDN